METGTVGNKFQIYGQKNPHMDSTDTPTRIELHESKFLFQEFQTNGTSFVIDPLAPPAPVHVNHVSLMQQNIKLEPDDIECTEDPLSNNNESVCADGLVQCSAQNDVKTEFCVPHESRDFSQILEASNGVPRQGGHTYLLNISIKNGCDQFWCSAHTAERPYRCEICGGKFLSQENLNEHMKRHPERNMTHSEDCKCEICASQDHLGYILNNTRGKGRLYVCKSCGKQFNYKAGLIHHNIMIHTEVSCQICDKKFGGKSTLKTHMRTHTTTGKKPYYCTICRRHFMSKAYLNNHTLRYHEEIRLYKCEICGKEFSKLRIELHKRLHTS